MEQTLLLPSSHARMEEVDISHFSAIACRLSNAVDGLRITTMAYEYDRNEKVQKNLYNN